MLVLRNTKGSPLTWAEIDGNFTYLDGLIAGKAAAAHGHVISDVSGLQASLDAKAPLATPTFTGGNVILSSAALDGFFKSVNTANAQGVLFGVAAAGDGYAWNSRSVAGVSHMHIGNGNANNTGSVFLYSGGSVQAAIHPIVGANQYVRISGNVSNGPVIQAVDATGGGAGINPNLYLSSGGSGSVYIYTNSLGNCQFRFDHTANATRFITVTGATASGNPVLGTSGGQLLIAGTNPSINGTAGNGLQYLDITNSNTGASAGSILRLITSNAAGSGTVSFYIVKYKTGAAGLINDELSGSGYLNLGAYGTTQVQIQPVQSANRIITLAGSNGGNPTISTSGGSLAITPPLQLTNILVVSNQINENITNATTELAFNFSGYAGGSTQFRNTVIYNGKGVTIAQFRSNIISLDQPTVFTAQTVGTTVGATGAAAALPANPLGYLNTSINGTACKIPYYN